MRKHYRHLLVFAAIALIALGAAGDESHADVKLEFMIARCFTGDEIAADTRERLQNSALRFVRTLLGANPEAAHAAFTSEAKRVISVDGLATLVRQSIQPWAPFKNLHVTQAHLVTIIEGGYDGHTVCGKLAHPEDRVTVAIKPVPEQAHVIIEADNINNSWAFVLWLIPEPDWHVQYFHVATAGMAGKSAQDVWNLARQEQRQNHHFNATVLYRTASGLANRGSALELGIHPEIAREMAELQVPRELSGDPPFAWAFGDKAFHILGVGASGVGGKIYLYISQEIAPWPGEEVADARNHDLIEEFTAAYPEYSAAFAGLIVAARDQGGVRGYRTIHVVESTSN